MKKPGGEEGFLFAPLFGSLPDSLDPPPVAAEAATGVPVGPVKLIYSVLVCVWCQKRPAAVWLNEAGARGLARVIMSFSLVSIRFHLF